MTLIQRSDTELIDAALGGDRRSLSTLIGRYTPFVFNLALKMFARRSEAEDITQAVFTVVITSLRTFRRESAFSTWLYRIAVNQCLSTVRKSGEAVSFETFFDEVARVAVPPEDEAPLIDEATVEELRVRCTSGMLLCLDRDQRITFILGAMLGVGDSVAAEVLGISRANFRVRLHRARSDLESWMKARCGLVDANNPCSCPKKARGYLKAGLLDSNSRTFTRERSERVDSLVRTDTAAAAASLYEQHFRSHPAQACDGDTVRLILGRVASSFELS